MEQILNLYGTFEPYANPFENLHKISYNKLKLLTYEVFHNEWKSKLELSSKADTYRTIKPSMKFEPHLLHPFRRERVLLTKLRVSDHKLMIEEGRRMRPQVPRPNRTCHMCKDKVEDEVHFLTECKLYGSKDTFWNNIYQKFPEVRSFTNEDKFIFLMTQENEETTKMVLKINHDWLSLRNYLNEYFFQ